MKIHHRSAPNFFSDPGARHVDDDASSDARPSGGIGRIGRDVSLMSCNTERFLLMGVHPSLTTIDVRAAEIGERTIGQLAWRIVRASASVTIGLAPTFVTGASVARRGATKDQETR